MPYRHRRLQRRLGNIELLFALVREARKIERLLLHPLVVDVVAGSSSMTAVSGEKEEETASPRTAAAMGDSGVTLLVGIATMTQFYLHEMEKAPMELSTADIDSFGSSNVFSTAAEACKGIIVCVALPCILLTAFMTVMYLILQKALEALKRVVRLHSSGTADWISTVSSHSVVPPSLGAEPQSMMPPASEDNGASSSSFWWLRSHHITGTASSRQFTRYSYQEGDRPEDFFVPFAWVALVSDLCCC